METLDVSRECTINSTTVWYMSGITNSGAVQNNFLVMRRLLVRERRVNTSLAKAASGRGWLDLPVR